MRGARCVAKRRDNMESSSRDHPRGCGEHPANTLPACLSAGSSPRMRGAPDTDGEHQGGRRIIPADAGSTSSLNWPVSLIWDHPRGCGEHSVAFSVAEIEKGSSPRMRGAPNSLIQERSIGGIIPADAGSTKFFGHSLAEAEDHPRGCGEHQSWLMVCGPIAGSSPRMREALVRTVRCENPTGIIPADAGSTIQILGL